METKIMAGFLLAAGTMGLMPDPALRYCGFFFILLSAMVIWNWSPAQKPQPQMPVVSKRKTRRVDSAKPNNAARLRQIAQQSQYGYQYQPLPVYQGDWYMPQRESHRSIPIVDENRFRAVSPHRPKQGAQWKRLDEIQAAGW